MSEYRVVRKWKDGRILVKQITQDGLFGYSQPSEDTNRFLLMPNKTYIAHVWNGFVGKRGDLEFEGQKYEFRGYY